MDFVLQTIFAAASVLCPSHECGTSISLPVPAGQAVPLVVKRARFASAHLPQGVDWGADIFVVQHDARRIGIELGMQRVSIWMESPETYPSNLGDHNPASWADVMGDGEVWTSGLYGEPRRL